MQVFLGDYITLINGELKDTPPTVVSGQIRGIVLDDDKELSFVYIAGVDSPFWITDGWKFVDNEAEVEQDDD